MPVRAVQAHVLIREINSSPTWLSLLLSSWPPVFQPHRSCRKMQMGQSSRSITGIRGDRAVSRVPHQPPLGLFPQRIIITVPSSAPAKDPSPFRAQKLFSPELLSVISASPGQSEALRQSTDPPRFQEDSQMLLENMVWWSSKGGKCSRKGLAEGPSDMLMCWITLLGGAEITSSKSLIMEPFLEHVSGEWRSIPHTVRPTGVEEKGEP